jgi:hypothetical protein
LLAKRQFNDRRRFGVLFWFNRRDFQRNESWQRNGLLITVKRYPAANDSKRPGISPCPNTVV